MLIRRVAENDILNGAKYFPVVAILGPRQSGKTTIARELFSKHTYLSLEDLDLRVAALQDPRTFLLTHNNEFGIIIDEFQYAPDLLSYIQTIVDREQRSGYFILTGSQNFLMNQAISQSLAGRVSIHTLLPLSSQELRAGNLLPAEVEPMLFAGCYPAIYSKKIPADMLYKNYLQTYIERDVRNLANIGDLTTFKTFLAMCAMRIGQPLNITSLGNDCGISDSTAKRWLSILEASYIIFLLRPYHANFGKRLMKTPKLYFYDTGLACHLLNIKEQDLMLHPNRGNVFESFVISDVLKWFYNHGKMPRIYFWQDKSGREIDLIIDEVKQQIPLEIKASRTVSQRFFENLTYWNELAHNQDERGFVIYAGSSGQPRGYPNVISWQLLSELLTKIIKD